MSSGRPLLPTVVASSRSLAGMQWLLGNGEHSFIGREGSRAMLWPFAIVRCIVWH